MDIMAATSEGQAALDRAQSRMEQYHRIVNESVTPETVSEVPAPLPPVWPEDGVQDDADSDNDVPAPLGNIEASIDAIYNRYVETKPDGTRTKEGIRQVSERLDLEYTSKAERRRLRKSKSKTTNDVSEVYSSPRVIGVAEAIGLRAGWALDLTVNKENDEPWDLSKLENQVAALKLQEEEAPLLLIASPMCVAFSSLQNLNYRKITPKELQAKLRSAMEHLDFALNM